MPTFPALDYRALGAELLIVFIGLFAALQLDEWRDERALDEAELRYLERLRSDLGSFIEFAGKYVGYRALIADAVRHVNDSLVAGEILGGDRREFEQGLIFVAHLPDLRMQRSSYDEMVAAGMFARLKSEDLKRAVSMLYSMQGQVERLFSWWRDGPVGLSDYLEASVTYYSDGPASATGDAEVDGEAENVRRRADFDFDALRRDLRVRNGFYWATDTHDDWIRMTRALQTQAEKALTILDAELARRQ